MALSASTTSARSLRLRCASACASFCCEPVPLVLSAASMRWTICEKRSVSATIASSVCLREVSTWRDQIGSKLQTPSTFDRCSAAFRASKLPVVSRMSTTLGSDRSMTTTANTSRDSATEPMIEMERRHGLLAHDFTKLRTTHGGQYRPRHGVLKWTIRHFLHSMLSGRCIAALRQRAVKSGARSHAAENQTQRSPRRHQHPLQRHVPRALQQWPEERKTGHQQRA